jgi:hypothetical protein
MTEETKDLTGMINVEVLLIRAVSAIVSAYSELIAERREPWPSRVFLCN